MDIIFPIFGIFTIVFIIIFIFYSYKYIIRKLKEIHKKNRLLFFFLVAYIFIVIVFLITLKLG